MQSRKRRIARGLEQVDSSGTDRPEMAASNIQYEIADRARAINAGGINAAHPLVKRLGLDEAINERLNLLKVHLPYFESDHILSVPMVTTEPLTLRHRLSRGETTDGPAWMHLSRKMSWPPVIGHGRPNLPRSS